MRFAVSKVRKVSPPAQLLKPLGGKLFYRLESLCQGSFQQEGLGRLQTESELRSPPTKTPPSQNLFQSIDLVPVRDEDGLYALAL